MEVVIPAARASLADRLSAAWYAFKMETKPDVKAAMEHFARIAEQQKAEATAKREARQAALDKLQPYDKAWVTAISTGAGNSDQLLSAVMPAIELLDVDDQVVVVRHIVVGNRQMTSHPAIRSWVMRNMRDVLANLPE